MRESVSTEYWIDMTGETGQVGEESVHCHFVHHESHMSYLAIEPGRPRLEAGDCPPPQPWHSLRFVFYVTVLNHVGILL
jgi:hypothetical protein